LNQLSKLRLIRRTSRGYRARSEVVEAFLPPMASTED